MERVELLARRAVGRDEPAAGPQHPSELGEDPVLGVDGRHVVQHVERDRAAEPVVGQVERGRVAEHDHDVGAREPGRERVREHRVDLDRGEPCGTRVRTTSVVKPGPGPISSTSSPSSTSPSAFGITSSSTMLPPVVARAELHVGFVHAHHRRP